MAFGAASISAPTSIFSAPRGVCHGGRASRVTLKEIRLTGSRAPASPTKKLGVQVAAAVAAADPELVEKIATALKSNPEKVLAALKRVVA